jgi:LmbE family N-acetylglucosaminyl deacetylase
VVVLSPHLDDAVLSLGALLSAHVRSGGRVRVVTVFAGRPDAVGAAGEWDRSAGFSIEGQAARARRAEDRAACARLGLEARHIDAADEQYPDRLGADALWERLAPALRGADELLLPGYPLRNDDHAAVTGLVLTRTDPAQLVRLWLEEPYALRERAPSPHRWGDLRWGAPGTARTEALAKVRAVRCYGSQLPLLAPGRLSPPSRAGAAVTVAQLGALAVSRGEWTTAAVPALNLTERSRVQRR